MPIARRLDEALTPIIDFAFPARCPICGAGLAQQLGLCSACWQQMTAFVSGRVATGCSSGSQAEGGATRPAALRCEPQGRLADAKQIIGATRYGEESRKLVLALKYGRRIGLANLMGRLITAKLGSVPNGAVFVPVPLHRWRIWYRGFNQSALIARAAHCHRRRAGFDADEIQTDVLIRRKRTPPLKGMSSEERAAAVAGAIALKRKGGPGILGREVVLIDDVLTSGATSAECVTALNRGGAENVTVACFALGHRWR